MKERSNCYCRLCRLERDLIGQSSVSAYQQEYRAILEVSPALQKFSCANALLEHLRLSRFAAASEIPSDTVFRELLRAKIMFPKLPVVDHLFVLAFVPAIHGTLRQLFKRHPGISSEDAGQHAILTLLEFLTSGELRTRSSHFAFAISRKIKRSIFEWAGREIRQASEETYTTAAEPAEESFERFALLRHFLQSSVTKKWLSDDELDLLIQFKLDGNSGEELGENNGVSANALRQRAKRLVAKLRRLASEPNGSSYDRELFS